jgi:hypothetical protein
MRPMCGGLPVACVQNISPGGDRRRINAFQYWLIRADQSVIGAMAKTDQARAAHFAADGKNVFLIPRDLGCVGI